MCLLLEKELKDVSTVPAQREGTAGSNHGAIFNEGDSFLFSVRVRLQGPWRTTALMSFKNINFAIGVSDVESSHRHHPSN